MKMKNNAFYTLRLIEVGTGRIVAFFPCATLEVACDLAKTYTLAPYKNIPAGKREYMQERLARVRRWDTTSCATTIYLYDTDERSRWAIVNEGLIESI